MFYESLIHCRQSLTSTAGSARCIDWPYILKHGWESGRSVILGEDPRFAHIIPLASAITKVTPTAWHSKLLRRLQVYNSNDVVNASQRCYKSRRLLWFKTWATRVWAEAGPRALKACKVVPLKQTILPKRRVSSLRRYPLRKELSIRRRVWDNGRPEPQCFVFLEPQNLFQVPWVLMAIREHGRYAVSGSPAFNKLKDKIWLPQFCQWLFEADHEDHIVIEDASEHVRWENQGDITV